MLEPVWTARQLRLNSTTPHALLASSHRAGRSSCLPSLMSCLLKIFCHPHTRWDAVLPCIYCKAMQQFKVDAITTFGNYCCALDLISNYIQILHKTSRGYTMESVWAMQVNTQSQFGNAVAVCNPVLSSLDGSPVGPTISQGSAAYPYDGTINNILPSYKEGSIRAERRVRALMSQSMIPILNICILFTAMSC